MWSNHYLQWVVNDEISEKYTELQGRREQCAVEDWVVIALLPHNGRPTKTGCIVGGCYYALFVQNDVNNNIPSYDIFWENISSKKKCYCDRSCCGINIYFNSDEVARILEKQHAAEIMYANMMEIFPVFCSNYELPLLKTKRNCMKINWNNLR